MHVAVVTPDWPETTGGGVATLARALALGLGALGHRVSVWIRAGGDRSRALREARVDPGVELRPLPGRSWRAGGELQWARSLAAALETGRPDALIVMTWEPAAGLLCLDAVPPWIVFAHGRDVTATLAPEPRSRLRDRTLLAAPAWAVLTCWMQRELRARGVERPIHLVPAAVPPPASAPRPVTLRVGEGPPTLLFVGRLVARKGINTLIEAMAHLTRPARLLVVGKGPEAGRLAAIVATHGLSDRVTLAGYLESGSLDAAWAGASCFVMVARDGEDGDTEGYGLTYLEAACAGLPSIARSTAGVGEAVVDGVTGLLLPARAGAVELAAAIENLLGDPALRERLARGARAWVRDSHEPRHLAAAVLAALPTGRP